MLAVHPNQITETAVNKNGKLTTVYQTRLDGKRPRCNTYEALIDKLYVHYFGAEPQQDFSFRAIFELALNSYVFVPMGLSPADRARILGHSVQTNLNHYTFARADEYLTEMAQIWDDYNTSSKPVPQNDGQYLKIVEFSEKKKPSRTTNSQGLIQKFS